MAPKLTHQELEKQYQLLKQEAHNLEHGKCRVVEDDSHHNQANLKTLVENVTIGIYRNTGGKRGRFLQANPAIAAIFGYDSVEEFLQVAVSDLYQDPEERILFIEELSKKGFIKNKELRLRKKDGTPIIGACTAKIHFDRNGAIQWIDGAIEDITERKAAQEQIRKSYHFEHTLNEALKIALEPISLEEQLNHILKLILEIPFLTPQSKGCIYLADENSRGLKLKTQSGLETEDRQNIPLLTVGKCLCDQAAATGNIVFTANAADPQQDCGEYGCTHGQYCVPVKSRGHVLGVLNLIIREGHKRTEQEGDFLNSIANTLAAIIEHKKTEEEKEKLQEQLILSEKLSALGRLTANVAHAIRNPLTAIGGLAKRLGKKIPAKSREKKYSDMIVSEADRLERILKSVLTFTSQFRLNKEQCNINEIVTEALHLYHSAHEEIRIPVESKLSYVPQLLLDKARVREVIDNLLANAAEATEAGGRIEVITAEEYVDGRQYVTVQVTDSGTGIRTEDLQVIFEPFFTTKAVGSGQGIGLGLAICKKIMEEHGGTIKIESEFGQGTTIHLFFPCQ